MMADNEQINITEDEAALYDRQIRLWGLDAQKRLRAAAVLLIGVGGVGAEVAKNIVLAGIKSLVLLDHRTVTEVDFASQFLLSRNDIGKNRAQSSLHRTQQLNPMVSVSYDTDNIDNKKTEFFKRFDVVCATCCSKQQLMHLNKPTITGFVTDHVLSSKLSEQNSREKVVHKSSNQSTESGEPPAKKHKTEESTTTTVQMKMKFSELSDSFNINWSSIERKKLLKKVPSAFFIYTVLLEFRDKYGRDPDPKQAAQERQKLLELKDHVLNNVQVDKNTVDEIFVKYCFGELSPVCAITGGVLGQEIIKAVSKKDEPHNNFFFYNGVEGSGLVDHISLDTTVHKETCFANAK